MQLDATGSRGVADSAGMVTLSELLPGPYTVSLIDMQLSALDISLPTSLHVTTVRDTVVEAQLEVASAEDFVGKRCERDQRISGGAWVLGRVVSADGQPVSEARWVINDEFGSRLVAGGRVGRDGTFHWCQLPLNKRVEVEAWVGERRVKVTRVLTGCLTTMRLQLPREMPSPESSQGY
ncbi:hypothetical protein BH11GEM1_BH11GEM1_19610 [soil metagenome]